MTFTRFGIQTQTALKLYSEYTLKEVEFHNEIRSYVHESWRELLNDFGIKHPESCFSKNYPPELVREYLERLIADIIINIEHDEKAFENIVKTFVAPILAQENCDELADRYLHNTVNALMQTFDIKPNASPKAMWNVRSILFLYGTTSRRFR